MGCRQHCASPPRAESLTCRSSSHLLLWFESNGSHRHMRVTLSIFLGSWAQSRLRRFERSWAPHPSFDGGPTTRPFAVTSYPVSANPSQPLRVGSALTRLNRFEPGQRHHLRCPRMRASAMSSTAVSAMLCEYDQQQPCVVASYSAITNPSQAPHVDSALTHRNRFELGHRHHLRHPRARYASGNATTIAILSGHFEHDPQRALQSRS